MTCRKHSGAYEQDLTLTMEDEHGLRTGDGRLDQRLTLSVWTLSVDTDLILHCGLQAFDGHFCLICKGSEKQMQHLYHSAVLSSNRHSDFGRKMCGGLDFHWQTYQEI